MSLLLSKKTQLFQKYHHPFFPLHSKKMVHFKNVTTIFKNITRATAVDWAGLAKNVDAILAEFYLRHKLF